MACQGSCPAPCEKRILSNQQAIRGQQQKLLLNQYANDAESGMQRRSTFANSRKSRRAYTNFHAFTCLGAQQPWCACRCGYDAKPSHGCVDHRCVDAAVRMSVGHLSPVHPAFAPAWAMAGTRLGLGSSHGRRPWVHRASTACKSSRQQEAGAAIDVHSLRSLSSSEPGHWSVLR